MRALATALAGLCLGVALDARAAEISISCSALGQEYEICKQGVDAWAKQTGNTVRIVSTPNSATERLALYQQLLAAGAGDIDVFQIDVVWPGILGQHFVDLSEKAKGAIDKHFATIVRNNTVERFGSVRSVARTKVVEVAFEGLNRSTRHKSGVAMRFPRINRIRDDKPAVEADHLSTLQAMLDRE